MLLWTYTHGLWGYCSEQNSSEEGDKEMEKGAMDVPYQELSALRFKEDHEDDDEEEIHRVTVVAGKERRVFKVDPEILQDGFFRVLLKKGTMREEDKKSCIILLEHCDSILFEHILWLVYNHDPSLLSVNLEELIEFYAQDAP